MKMGMEHWWNDIDRRTPNFFEKRLIQCQLEHHKINTKSPRTEAGHPWGEAGN
jgi:hypothetical protein